MLKVSRNENADGTLKPGEMLFFPLPETLGAKTLYLPAAGESRVYAIDASDAKEVSHEVNLCQMWVGERNL